MNLTPFQAGLQSGLGFAIVWGLAMWFLDWRDHTSALAAVGWAAAAGVLYGLFIAWLTKRDQRKGQD